MISPCVKICKIANEVCVGCGRTTDEIRYWSILSHQERLDVMDRLATKKYSSEDITRNYDKG